MTVLDDLRGRLIGALQLELRNAGVAAPSTLAASIATKALDKAQVPALLAYVAAAEGAAGGVDVVVDGGETPDDLPGRVATWRGARDQLAADPLLASILP